MPRTHRVVNGDRLTWISRTYYGVDTKASEIVKANPKIAGRPISLEGYPIIYQGDILTIPDIEPPKPPEKIQNVSENAISIIIDGNLFSYFTSYNINFEIGTFDTFSFSSPFDESLEIYRNSFRAFAYKPVSIYYGQELIFTGTLLAPQVSTKADGKDLSITGYSKPAILQDCNMPISSFPLEFNNQNLNQITSTICRPFGLKYQFLSPAGNVFEKVSLEIEKDPFSLLADLSKQRGLLLTNDAQGQLIYYQPSGGQPVASFKEGELPFLECAPTFNPQNFYSHITGVTKTTETTSSVQYTYENNYLINQGIFRPYNCTLEDVLNSEIKQAVISKAGRMFGESASYSLKVQGHKDRNGNLYKKNTIVTLYTPGSMVYTESTFLAKSVKMSRTTDGDTTDFDLVLPGIYNGNIPTRFPWEE